MIGKDNAFFKCLSEFQKILNSTEKIDLKIPRICLVGLPNSGKSLLLESIIGLDIIPINQNLKLKRALELKLNHINSGEPYAIFEEMQEKKITNFSEISEIIHKIQTLPIKNYTEFMKPIILNIYSPNFPDITFFDLPGKTYIPVGACPKNIEEFPTQMVIDYSEDFLNLLICVIPANVDSERKFFCLRDIKDVIQASYRIVGVLTKIDMINDGVEYDYSKDFKNILINNEIPLKFGFVGVKNRSLDDINNKMSLEEAIKNEQKFFEKESPFYGKLPKDKVGYEIFINKLKKTYFEIIKENLSGELKSLYEKIINKKFIENEEKNKNLIQILEFIAENSYEGTKLKKKNEIILEKKEDIKNFKNLMDFIDENAKDD